MWTYIVEMTLWIRRLLLRAEYDVDAAAAYMRSFDDKIREMQASGKEFFGPKVLELCKAATLYS